MKTKDLKKLYFEEMDLDAQDRWKSEITPLAEVISEKNQETYTLLKDALAKKIFSAKAMEYYQRVLLKDDTLDEKKRLGRLSLWIDKVKDPQISKKYWQLRNEVVEARKLIWIRITKIESDYHYFILNKRIPSLPVEMRPVEAVECIVNDQRSLKWPPEALLNTVPVGNLNNITENLIIDNGFLYLQVDLSYDKKEILNLCDDIINRAQDLIGKIGKHSKTVWKQKIFDELFLEYYLSGMSKGKALEKIERYFFDLDIPIEADSLNKMYLPAFKERYAIKDIRQLKKGDFGEIRNPPI